MKSSMLQNDYIHIVDDFEEDFQTISGRKTIVEDLTYVNQSFHDAKTFDFVELNLADVYVSKADFRGDAMFSHGASDFNYNETQHKIKSASVGENCNEYFNLDVSSGRYFSADDYSFIGKHEVPILLGSDYQSLYKINDSIPLTIKSKSYSCTVIGFLEEESQIISFNFPIKLNQYIILPMEQFSTIQHSDDERTYQFRMMLDKNNGLILPKQKLSKVETEIRSICNNVKLPTYRLSQSYSSQSNEEYAKIISFSLLLCISILVNVFVIRWHCIANKRPKETHF